MYRSLLITAVVLILGLVAGTAWAQQQGYGQGPAPGGQGWFCPWCGQGQGSGYGMGPGMMYQGQGQAPGGPGQQMAPNQAPGYGMGPGMMQGQQGHGQGMTQGWHGRGRGPGMRGRGWGRGQNMPYAGQQQSGQQQMEPLDEEAAQGLAENYVARNPNLQVGEVNEKEDVYEANIVTKDGSEVEKLLIDKNSGWVKKEY